VQFVDQHFVFLAAQQGSERLPLILVDVHHKSNDLQAQSDIATVTAERAALLFGSQHCYSRSRADRHSGS
jgi:hypothetical protein